MSEYNEYNIYRSEAIKLNQFMNELLFEINEKHLDKEILIPLIIGSAMEDCLVKFNTSSENYFQYRQLFPNYINNFIKSNTNKKFIQLIIISPDNIFSSQSYVPNFILYESFDFVSTNPNEYIYNNEQIYIRINIFNCPFPCIEKRNNVASKYKKLIKNLQFNPYNITSYIQTQNDIKFINDFYVNIKKLFKSTTNSRIKIIINSWVSFKNLDGYSKNYNMFPELLMLANKYNIIATEWDFVEELFFAKIISEYKFGNNKFKGIKINYAFNEQLTDLPENVIAMNFNYNNLFVVDFNSEYLIKKFIYIPK